MTTVITESKYPLSFRKEASMQLGDHLRLRHSVEIVGMKRVGISDFLRYFLNRRGIVQKYIDRQELHLFITVDLNDLIEREVYPFWILTFKRLNDAVENTSVKESLKKDISSLFLNSIQSGDLFLTIENIRRAFKNIVDAGVNPTVFFIRFDRIIDNLSDDFFSNLEGLYDSSGQKLSYVFTSYRRIDEISSAELSRNFLHVFSNIIYITPASLTDIKVVYNVFKKRYKISFGGDIFKKIAEICGGHIQYLHLAVIILSQKSVDRKISKEEVYSVLKSDERIYLQSEEIFESLTGEEQEILLRIHNGDRITRDKREATRYLMDTGIINDKGNRQPLEIFSSLFENYLSIKSGEEESLDVVEFTKKENTLFNYLQSNIDAVCEREKIIEAVWSEEDDMGVSDWTIDRLVSRLRAKLKIQKSGYSVTTVKTRGFKLEKDTKN